MKKKYTAAKTKLKKTKQELEDVKSRKPETTFNTTEATLPRKMVMFTKKIPHLREFHQKEKSQLKTKQIKLKLLQLRLCPVPPQRQE